jgi:hypothetical protein
MHQNIWALDKDISIKHLMLMLVQCLGNDAFDLDEGQQGHPQSILIHKPDCLSVKAYLYTYGQETEHYGVHLEFPAIVNSQRFDNTEIYENITVDNLVEILAVHFDVPEPATNLLYTKE